MSKEVLTALYLFIGALFGFFFWHRIVQFWRWLKGSRERRDARRKNQNFILEQWQLKDENDRINKQIHKEELAEALQQRIQDIRDDL
ncbi:MAG: hypothetical protein Q8Q89_03745 [bacterium]|nr:hypothetical protein [bacterium]